MPTTVDAKNTMLDALTLNTIKIHSEDPGVDGTSNQISGASKAATYGSASNAIKDITGTVSFTGLNAGTVVKYFSVWNSATFIASKIFPNGGETFNNPNGTFNVTSAALTVSDV